MYWLTQIALIIAILIVIGIPMWLWESRAKRKKIEETFAKRQPLDERTFYERYFESRGVSFFVVSKVREILEDELEADLSRLSAADDFKKNLSFFWQYDSMADVEVVLRLEEEFSIKITDAEAERTNTVEDLVDLVWLKLR
jgi:acyl carrier protein